MTVKDEPPGTAGDARDVLSSYREALNDFRLDRQSSALVVVDLQVASADATQGWLPLYKAAGFPDVAEKYLTRLRTKVLPNVANLLAAFRAAGAPILYLVIGTASADLADMPPHFQRAARRWRELGDRHPFAMAGSEGIKVLAEIAPREGEIVIRKPSRSGFTSTSLERVLWNLGARELAFCGVATNACVEFTLRDALDRGFDCVLIEDACAAATDEIHDLGVRSIAQFCRVESSQAVIRELSASPDAVVSIAKSRAGAV